ncbi:MAG TPA: DUF72 domain-containing protein [Minicystis sp.]|nr:DUF72 domain-containing protein [Minicystis sp.]
MLWVGTSGYSYAEWKGSFYPEKMPQAKMFAYYAARFSTVEINNTFYRMPDAKLLEGWRDAAPPGFRFALKAPQRITHVHRLKPEAEDTLRVFCERARLLGDKLGPVLFQLPPNQKKDVERLAGFLALVPGGVRAAFEFRHPSWFDDEVFAALRARGAALCIADSEKLATPPVATAPFGYLRLRDEGYDDAGIAAWHARITELSPGWDDAFVFFKHEQAGKGPAFARQLLDLAARPSGP